MVLAFLVAAATVVLGVMVLAFWSSPERTAVDRRSVALASLHVVVALSAVGVWAWFLVGRADQVGAAALAGILTAAALGVATLVSSRRRERSGRYGEVPDPVPLVLLGAHGTAAAGAALLMALALARG